MTVITNLGDVYPTYSILATSTNLHQQYVPKYCYVINTKLMLAKQNTTNISNVDLNKLLLSLTCQSVYLTRLFDAMEV